MSNDSSPGTLVKAKPSITGSHMGTKQYLLCMGTGYIDIHLADYALKAYNASHYNLFGFYITIGLLLSAFVWFCIKDELAWYRITNLLDFLQRWVRKSDFIYLYDEKKTSDEQLNEHVKVRDMEPTGLIWFNKLKTYDNNYCNTGIVFLLSPNEQVGDTTYNDTLLTLFYSLKRGTETKMHYLTSKIKNNIAAAYEEKLKGNLTPETRAGIYEAKKYLLSRRLKTRPAHYMFVGLGYYTKSQKETAINEAARLAAAYKLFLEHAGIDCRQIMTQAEYNIIYKQFYKMENTGVLTV